MKNSFFALFIVCILFTSCQKSATPIPVSRASATSNSQQILYTPTVQETETPILSAMDKVICPTVELANNVVSGELIYVDYDNFSVASLDLATSETHSLIKDGFKMISYALSPNGEFLAYQATNLSSNQEQLILKSTGPDAEQEEIQFNWDADWDKVAYWLDKENLIIKLFPDQHYRVLLLNPFSGQKQELIADFPNIYSLDPWPPDWYGSGQFVFNAALNRVIYADINQRFILWDYENQKELSQLQAMTFRQFPSKAPQWNLDGNQAVVAVPKKSLDYMNDELFSINQEGTIEQLTDFTNAFSDVSINRYSWSPDSHYIAMLVSVLPGNYVEQLVVFDMHTREQTLFCIQGDTTIINSVDYRRSPKGFFDDIIYRGVVWSADNQRVIVENRITKNSSNIILVDVSHLTAYKLLDGVNYLPIGWKNQKE